MNIASELLEMKTKIEKAKTDKAQAEGRLEGIMEQLKDEFDCHTIEEAQEKCENLVEQANKLKTELEDQLTKVKQEYFQ